MFLAEHAIFINYKRTIRWPEQNTECSGFVDKKTTIMQQMGLASSPIFSIVQMVGSRIIFT